MSGFFYGDDTLADDARTRMMAQVLQGNQSQGQQSPFGGIGQALAMKAMQNRQAQKAYDNVAPITANLQLPGMNGQTVPSQLSIKMPYMGPQGLSGLFNFGGGS